MYVCVWGGGGSREGGGEGVNLWGRQKEFDGGLQKGGDDQIFETYVSET